MDGHSRVVYKATKAMAVILRRIFSPRNFPFMGPRLVFHWAYQNYHKLWPVQKPMDGCGFRFWRNRRRKNYNVFKLETFGVVSFMINPGKDLEDDRCNEPLRRRICGSFFLSVSSEKNFILVKTLPYFTQMMIFSPNTSFWTGVIWWLFHDELRSREREENHKIRA